VTRVFQEVAVATLTVLLTSVEVTFRLWQFVRLHQCFKSYVKRVFCVDTNMVVSSLSVLRVVRALKSTFTLGPEYLKPVITSGLVG
jgi:hypothetical protein